MFAQPDSTTLSYQNGNARKNVKDQLKTKIKKLGETTMVPKQKNLRILIIDDDPIFSSLMERVAVKAGFDVETYESLEDLGHLGSLGNFDLAIVDYQLEQMTGVEIAQYLDAFFGNIPMILVSANEKSEIEMKQWPKSIKCFVSKHDGFAEVINAAKYACNV